MTAPTSSYGQFWTKSQVITFVQECYDRDVLLRVLLNYASQWHRGRLVCLITRTHIQPFIADGWISWGSDDETMRMLVKNRFSIDQNETLHAIIERGAYTLGDPEEVGFAPLFDHASVTQPNALVLMPIILGGKTKMLFLGELDQMPQDLESFGNDVEPLATICAHVAQQLERLILAAKQGTLPPEDQRIPPVPQSTSSVSLASLSRPSAPTLGLHDESSGSGHTEASLGLSHSSTEGSEKPASAVPHLSSEVRRTQPISLEQLRAYEKSQPLSEASKEESEPNPPMLSAPSAAELSTSESSHGSHSPPFLSAATASSAYSEHDEDSEPMHMPPGSVALEPTLEQSGVSVIQPIAIEDQGSHAKRTLMGGYSIKDIERSKAEFTARPNSATTLIGVQAPQAQIFKRRKRKKPSPPSIPKTTQKMILDEVPKKDPAPKGGSKNPATHLEYSQNSVPITEKLEAVEPVVISSKTPMPKERSTEQRQSKPPAIPKEADPKPLSDDVPPTLILPAVESEASSKPDAHVGGEFATEKMDAITKETPKTQLVSEVSSPLSDPQMLALKELSGRDLNLAFAAAQRLSPEPATFAELSKAFPGRLAQDRYQYTPTTLPEVSLHGPLLSALVNLGGASIPTITEHLNSTSLDRRFYATFLFTKISPKDNLLDLFPRLFDRDAQTREVATQIMIDNHEQPHFSRYIIPELHSIIESSPEEVKVETAVHILGKIRHLPSMEILISALDRHRNRTNQAIHKALQRITLQPLPAASIAWRTWEKKNPLTNSRTDWILLAMNSPNSTIREMVAEELSALNIEGLQYNPAQPPSMRIRAQQFMQEWFDMFSP